MRSEKIFASEWSYLLKSNESGNMFDVDAVLDENIKNGRTYNFNEFEKCVDFIARDPNDDHLIRGEYILVGYESSSKIHYSGLCFPASTNPEALKSIANASLDGFNKILKANLYHDFHTQLRIVDYLAIALFTIWALIVVASTTYECITISKKAFISLSNSAYDSIFIVSGFLLAIYCFRTFKAKNLNYLSLLLHRYIRYGPMLLISIIYQLTLFQYTFRGPIAPKAFERVQSCEKYWFMSLLMLENYMRPDHMCVYHGWYFSIDFQFFLILPLLVYICYKSRKIGFIILGFLVAISYIAMFSALIYSNTSYDVLNRSSIYDMHSYFRCAPWLLSIVLASFCLKEEYTVKKKFRILNSIVAFLVLILLLIFVYLLQNYNIAGNDVVASAIFASFHRIFWSVGICWMIFYCYNLKEGDWFDGIINSSAWRPIAKISLTLQIVYPVYQHTTTFDMKEPYYFYSWAVFHTALGDILICVVISLILNASVEMPFVWIERLLSDKRHVKPTRNVKKIENDMDEVALKLPETLVSL
ncbi:hypothetical protein ACKWTF_011745 [Chironomus riparius]